MKFRSVLAATAVFAVILAGCGGEESKVTDTPKTGSNASSESPEPAVADDEGEELTEAPSENPAFGQTVTYENGLEVTISRPKPTEIGEYAAMADTWPAYIALGVRVVNNTGENFDVSSMYFTLQSGDVEAEQIFDSENGFEGTPSTKVLDGRQSRFKIGFGVNDPDDIVLEVATGDYDLESTLFTN